MRNECENLYKISRTTAGLTQEAAAELLAVSPRTLSDYENDRARVPDEMVAAMTEAYNSPLLAYYHLKRYSPLGRFLPEIQEPQTNGDMAFQAIIARDELDPAVESMKRIVADGRIDDTEREQFTDCIETMRKVNGKIFSVIAYADKGVKHDKSNGKNNDNTQQSGRTGGV